MNTKTKTVKPPTVNNPINVAIPSTTSEKMEAILHLSMAVKELAKALNSINVTVAISNNTVTSANGPGISINPV